jgi:hypothetical protein
VEPEIALDPCIARDAPDAAEAVVGVFEKTDRGPFERDRAAVPGCAGADATGLEDGPPRCPDGANFPGGCQACEARADDGDVDGDGSGLFRHRHVDPPWSLAPRVGHEAKFDRQAGPTIADQDCPERPPAPGFQRSA